MRGDDGDEAKRDKAFVNLLSGQKSTTAIYSDGPTDPDLASYLGEYQGSQGSPPERPCPERELPI